MKHANASIMLIMHQPNAHQPSAITKGFFQYKHYPKNITLELSESIKVRWVKDS